jgi:hypothetical protein
MTIFIQFFVKWLDCPVCDYFPFFVNWLDSPVCDYFQFFVNWLDSPVSNRDLDLWPNDPKINRILPLPQGNPVAKFGKDPTYRTTVIVRKPVWTPWEIKTFTVKTIHFHDYFYSVFCEMTWLPRLWLFSIFCEMTWFPCLWLFSVFCELTWFPC